MPLTHETSAVGTLCWLIRIPASFLATILVLQVCSCMFYCTTASFSAFKVYWRFKFAFLQVCGQCGPKGRACTAAFQSYLWWSCAFWWDDNWCDWRARYMHTHSTCHSKDILPFLLLLSLADSFFGSCVAVVPLLESATTAPTVAFQYLGAHLRLPPFRLGQLQVCLFGFLHQYANRRSHIHCKLIEHYPFTGHFILLYFSFYNTPVKLVYAC